MQRLEAQDVRDTEAQEAEVPPGPCQEACPGWLSRGPHSGLPLGCWLPQLLSFGATDCFPFHQTITPSQAYLYSLGTLIPLLLSL